MERQNEIEIDLLDLMRYLLKRAWIIALVLVLCVAIGAGVTAYGMDEEFTADTRLYILNQSLSSSLGSIAYSDFQISDKMMEDYMVLMTGRNVLQEVIDVLGLDVDRKTLSEMMTVTALGDSRVIEISVTDTDPQRAADIANCIREVAGRQIKEIMDVDAVNLVFEAEVPEKKSGPSITQNGMISGLLGLLLCVGVFVVTYLMDDTIRTEEDVERHLGLSVLGVVPVFSDKEKFAEDVIRSGRDVKTRAAKRPRAKK